MTVTRPALHLTLPWPPALSSYYRPIVRGSFAKLVRTAIAKQYRDEVARVVRHKLGPVVRPIFTGPVRLDVELRPPDNRRRDIDNACGKSLLDSMTHALIWEDDSQVREMTVRFAQVIRGGTASIIVTDLGSPC